MGVHVVGSIEYTLVRAGVALSTNISLPSMYMIVLRMYTIGCNAMSVRRVVPMLTTS